jgi:hypothetical protein
MIRVFDGLRDDGVLDPPQRRGSIEAAFAGGDTPEEQLCRKFPWISKTGTEINQELDFRQVQNAWRCFYLLDRACKGFHASSMKLSALREKTRQTLRLLSVTMKRLRCMHESYTATE